MKAADQISADLQRVLWAWSLLLVVGLLSLAAGVVVLAKPHISLATLAVVTGIFLLADGVLELFYALVRRGESRAVPAVIGIVSVVGGVILVRHPTKAVAVIALLLGIWLIIMGVVRVIRAVDQPAHRGWSILSGTVELLGGIVVVSSPDIGVATLALLVGITFVVRGLVLCAVAWALHRATGDLSAATHDPAAAT